MLDDRGKPFLSLSLWWDKGCGIRRNYSYDHYYYKYYDRIKHFVWEQVAKEWKEKRDSHRPVRGGEVQSISRLVARIGKVIKHNPIIGFEPPAKGGKRERDKALFQQRRTLCFLVVQAQVWVLLTLMLSMSGSKVVEFIILL